MSLDTAALIAIAGCASACLLPASGMAQSGATAAKPRQLSVESKPWKGDFDGMLERRTIRVLLPYSRTFFFMARRTARERSLRMRGPMISEAVDAALADPARRTADPAGDPGVRRRGRAGDRRGLSAIQTRFSRVASTMPKDAGSTGRFPPQPPPDRA